jgi:hypothetical protein
MQTNKLISLSPKFSLFIKRNVFKIIIPLIVILISDAYSQSLSGHINLNQNIVQQFQDGEKTSETEKLSQNLYLDMTNFITPHMSYHLYLRESLSDSDLTDAAGSTVTTYKRALEPAVDFVLRNPMYSILSGYRRQEEWSTARLINESRTSTVFYYTRFNITPTDLPSLSLDFDQRSNFDHLMPKTVDTTNTDYSISSIYSLPSKKLNLRYLLNFSHTIDKTPLTIIQRVEGDALTANYNVGYSDFLWDRKTKYAVDYRGNFTRNKTKQFVSQTGTVTLERTALGGFRAQGNAINNDVDVLASDGLLVDDDLNSATAVNLSTGQYHNIGMSVSSGDSVTKLFVYVNNNVLLDTNLDQPSEWKVFSSNLNQVGAWTEISSSISSVTITAYDTTNNIYRYEIEFTAAQSALFFKAINLNTSIFANVFVTEIEAYGDDVFSTNESTSVINTFMQGIDMNASVRLFTKLSLAFNYSLDRSDTHPVSILNSTAGIFRNIFENSISSEDNANFRSSVTRNYSIAASWVTHRLLTTTLSFQKNESFDNIDLNDFASNTYRLLFYSSPLPTLDTTLSLVKNESFSFGEKASINDSILYSLSGKLYTDVNMITDMEYTKSRTLASDSLSTAYAVNGTIDARLLQKLTGTFNFAFSRTTSDDIPIDLTEYFLILNHRPGRFINITGNFRITDSTDDLTIAEGVSADWRPLRAVRLTLSYEHSSSDPGPQKTDTLNGLIIWYLTKFADLRFTYSYAKTVEEIKSESYNYNTTLNSRF